MINRTMLQNMLLQLFAPPYCYSCNVFLLKQSTFCAACADKIKPIVSTKISVSKQYEMPVIALCGYEEPVKSLILGKIRSDRTASKQLGILLWEQTIIAQLPYDYCIPIPLHWRRFAQRGYNQAEIIAAVLANKNGKELATILTRKKSTQLQSELDVEGRSENVGDAFALTVKNNDLYKNKHLLLVDDLMTTGATLQAAAKILTALKPASIKAIVGCRVI